VESGIGHHAKGSFVLGLFFTILLIANSSVYAEWTVVNPPSVGSYMDMELFDVHFTSTNEGWAVGLVDLGGVLLHYQNGSWTYIDPPYVSSDWMLQRVYFTSANEGWAAGRDFFRKTGVLLHYLNGSWTPIGPPYVSSDWGLIGINFTSSREGWAVGYDDSNKTGVLLHYNNGNWTVVNPPNVSSDWYLWDVYFTSSGEGWAVGEDQAQRLAVLLHYFNHSWTVVNPPYAVLYRVWFTSANDGWAVGASDKGFILHYSNGSWTSVAPACVTSDYWYLGGVHFISPSEGWVVGSGDTDKGFRGALLHYDGGSWMCVDPPEVSGDWLLHSVHFTSPTEGWAVGVDLQNNPKGLLLKYSLPETISTPDTPKGKGSGIIGNSYSYLTGGSTSNLGHSVEYQFDWKGDGSDLSNWGSATESKVWSAPGKFSVRARARCTQDNSAVSKWSGSLDVSIKTVVPNISVSPTTYDFKNVKIKKSKTASFKAMSNGTADLTISTSITGADASLFTITSGGGSKTIKPGRTLTIRVAFKPTSTGSKQATLRITSNDPIDPIVDIPLMGTGQ
jgi:hypothetical protein